MGLGFSRGCGFGLGLRGSECRRGLWAESGAGGEECRRGYVVLASGGGSGLGQELGVQALGAGSRSLGCRTGYGVLTLGERLELGCELPPGITYLRRLPIGGAVGLRQASLSSGAAPGTCPCGPREGRVGVRTWLHALPPSAGTTPAAPTDHSSPFPDNGSCGGGARRQEQRTETPALPSAAGACWLNPGAAWSRGKQGACLSGSPTPPPDFQQPEIAINWESLQD